MEALFSGFSKKIYPPSALTNKKWHVEIFHRRKTFSVPEIAVTIIIHCIEPKDKKSVIDSISSFYNLSQKKVESLVSFLIEKELLNVLEHFFIAENSESPIEAEEYQKWERAEWKAAAEYHFFTYNYDFLDYSKNADGWLIANERMNAYSEKNPDKNRIKSYPENLEKIKLHCPFDLSSGKLKETRGVKYRSDFNLEILSEILSFSFAKTGEKAVPWNGDSLIRRTSPSGGSRHPTEGYVFSLNTKGLDFGVYHIQSAPFGLTKLSTVEPQAILRLFPEFPIEIKNNLAAIVIMTSVFERNMYRYREPRTFRTIHIDVGHILGTMELITNSMDIKTKITHRFNEQAVEALLGIDGLSEGVMTGIGIYV